MRSRWPIVLLALLVLPYAIFQWFHVLGPAHVFAVVTGVVLVTALGALWWSVRAALAGDEAALDLSRETPERSALLEEKNVLLRALKDIDNEHAVGKLSDADFERMNEGYRERAKAVLAALDEDLGAYLDRARSLVGDDAPRGRAYEKKRATVAEEEADERDEAEEDEATETAAESDPLAEKLAKLPEDKRKEAEAYLAQLMAEPKPEAEPKSKPDGTEDE